MVVHVAQHRRSSERGALDPCRYKPERLYIEKEIDSAEAPLQLLNASERSVAEESVDLVKLALSRRNRNREHLV
jgi:hypothetical protein